MIPWPVLLIIPGVVALIGGIFLLVRYFDKKRREALQAFAEELNLEFHGFGHTELHSRLRVFKLFNCGHSRKMKNVILGETDFASIAMFDYRYTTGSGKHQHVHSQTVVAIEAPDLSMPVFSLRPEHMFDWFGSVLGRQDIDFDHHPTFSQAFVLKGENEDRIRDFFDQPLLDFFAERNGIGFETQPDHFIFFRAGRAVKVDDLRNFMNEGYQVFQALCERNDRSNG